MNIRAVCQSDISALVNIYNFYISNSTATFETEAIYNEEMETRIAKVSNSELPWLVAESDNGEVLGYAYATKWRERFAYRFSVEVSVYVSHLHGQKGIGANLYKTLFPMLASRNVHVAIGGITLPNPASIKLHEKFGMEKVAHFNEVGFKFDQWLDVGYWQKVL